MILINADNEKKQIAKTLIVEDNPPFQQILKYMLHENFPWMVIEDASNSKDALQKVDSFCLDLILLDIRLPDESGLELIQKIKKKYPDIIVIILTSYDLPDYREAAARYGTDAFMCKGLSTKEQILTMIESVWSQA